MKRPGFLLLLFCLLINLLQARYTELSNDEAYYWMYSRFPDWGYFDHPPMVALYIKLGYWLFQNELGVRLLTVFSQLATILLVWRLVERPGKEKYLPVFVLFSLAIPVFQVYGFITTPDVPLLLFAALYFNIYKSFTERITTLNTIALGVTMALLLYSKHHGLLLLVLTVVSNFRLLRTKAFYVASAIGLVLLVPQLWWQYKHEFPSIYYHFYWRASEFKVDNVTGFLLAQLFVFSPFLFPWLGFTLLKKRLPVRAPYERALLFTLWGFLIYFFVFSFRTRIEGHWTLLCCIPILYFSILWYIDSTEKIKKWIVGLSIASAVIVFAARSVLLFDILPEKNEFHKSVCWIDEVHSAAKGADVIFSSSFQRASKYSFYTRQLSHSLNTIWYRQNQFDIWNIEEQCAHKPTMLVSMYSWGEPEEKLALCNGDTMFLMRVDHFETTQKVRFNFEKPEHDAKRSEMLTMPVEITNNYPYAVNFRNPELPVQVRGYLCQFGKICADFSIDLQPAITSIAPGQTIRTTAILHLPEITGTYNMGMSLNAGRIPSTFNSVMRLITIN